MKVSSSRPANPVRLLATAVILLVLFYFHSVYILGNQQALKQELFQVRQNLREALDAQKKAKTALENPVKILRTKESNEIVGAQGGAWTAGTHLSQYGFNVDAGLVRVLEDSCRTIENARNEVPWSQHPSQTAPIGGYWRAPKTVDCRVLELGAGVGVYVDSLKKDNAKRKRKVFAIEPNPMGGVFERRNGPRQLDIDILATDDPVQLASQILRENYDNQKVDLIYSIEVCEHLPPERHSDAAKFLAGLARPGTKLIFGAAHPRQSGTGHIGNRPKSEWESILWKVGFVKNEQETLQVAHELDEYNHKVNTQVYYFQQG